MGRSDQVLDAVAALADVAELASTTASVRVLAIQALGNHWPQSHNVLLRFAQSDAVGAITAEARKVLAEHDVSA